jgi:hypothetical protein
VTYSEHDAPDTNQFQPPDWLLDKPNIPHTPQSQQPPVDSQNIPTVQAPAPDKPGTMSQFKLPSVTGGHRTMSQFKLPSVTGGHRTISQFKLPSATNSHRTISQFKLPSVTGQHHSAPQPQPSITGQQRTSQQFKLPSTTGRQNSLSQFKLPAISGQLNTVAPFGPPATHDQPEVAPWGLPPMTDPHNAVARPQPEVTGNPSMTQPQAVTALDEYLSLTMSQPVVAADFISSTMSQPIITPNSSKSQSAKEEIVLPPLEKSTPLIAWLCNIILIVAIIWLEQNPTLIAFKSSFWPGSTKSSLNDITNNKEISPLLFGTNMALFHDWDEPLLNSPLTRQQLKDIGVRVIRMPTRATLQDETLIAAANAIKAVGAVPLIVLHGPEAKDPDLVESNKRLLEMFTGIFGNEIVYYEFGNESDLQGIKADQYAESWNQVIPKLKPLYPSARFLGPDMHQFNRRYLKTFLQHAHPRPDGISWHEYACSIHWTNQFCLDNVDTWPVHFTQARAAMREAIGTELPIWITEWNYAPDQQLNGETPIDDGKYNNATFMKNWTTKAMNMLLQHRIHAAMQYYATSKPMPLINDDLSGIEGNIFQQNYKKIIVDGHVPPTTSSGPSAMDPKVLADTIFTFEDDKTSGWTSNAQNISSPTNSTEKALEGTHSLKVTLKNTNEDDTPYITLPGTQLPSTPKAGQMISAHLFVANNDALMNAKIFVADGNNHWQFANEITLAPGKWQRIWYALPMKFDGKINEIGIQFSTSRPGVATDISIDAIDWR